MLFRSIGTALEGLGVRWLRHILGLKVLGLRMCFRLAPVEEISPLSESFYKKKKLWLFLLISLKIVSELSAIISLFDNLTKFGFCFFWLSPLQ